MKQSTRNDRPTRMLDAPLGAIPGYWIVKGTGTDRTFLYEAHVLGEAAAAMTGMRQMFGELKFSITGPGAFCYGQYIPGYGTYRRMLPAPSTLTPMEVR